MAEKIIADVLDTALARHYEQLGDAEREKQAVVFMDGRWVAIRGDFTPDEIREAVEYIHRYRVSKKLQKSLEDISPFVVDNGEIFIKDAFITGGAIQAAADQKAMDELAKTIRKAIHNECLAGGIIWQRFNR